MPWETGKGFADKHNKKLKGAAAQKAANVATALVNKGEDEGKAIRIANSIGDKAMKQRKGSAVKHLGIKRSRGQ